ncbi:MAG: Lsr2 family protein [Propionibacteriaceae bacterium]|nr:Lsr2 family protein [Propionibacteriaceae bacterium]
MAQRTRVELIDDIDGSAASETISFGLDGKSYEIDLTAVNAQKLRKAFEPYVSVARKVTSGTRRVVRNIQLSAPQSVIRAWAQSKGLKISDRGRIPADIVKQYEEAHA